MMIQIDHRESHDVDIFLPDPQLLPFLDPTTHDFKFEIKPAEYSGDGRSFLKIAFKDVGEIDFIVGQAMTKCPTIQRDVEGHATYLETVPEIITKKIFYRGSTIKPRDIFDIAAAGQHDADAIKNALSDYRDHVAGALTAIDKLKPDFVRAAIASLAVREKFKPICETAIERTIEILKSV